MTLEEAIKHAEEVMEDNLAMTKDRNASDPVAINCFECADEHRQLAEWLKELQAYKEQYIPKSVIDDIRAEIESYQSDFDEHGTEYDRTAWAAYNRCLQIIDKYKGK